MGTGSTKGLRRYETLSYTTNDLDSTFIRSSVATVRSCFPHCSQCSASARETRRTSKEVSPNILCLRSRPGQKEPEPRNRTELTENRNRTNRTEGTVMKFGSGFLRTEINEIFSVLHSKEPKKPKEPKNP
jgi:hypothetical protein